MRTYLIFLSNSEQTLFLDRGFYLISNYLGLFHFIHSIECLSSSVYGTGDMIVVAALMSVAIAVISFILFEQSNEEHAYAQNQTQGTNFTQLFTTDKEFCLAYLEEAGCVPYINVLYEDPGLLVLSSDYIDVIWKGVAQAQKEGYQIDSMTSYALTSGLPSSGRSNVNLLVAMSK